MAMRYCIDPIWP